MMMIILRKAGEYEYGTHDEGSIGRWWLRKGYNDNDDAGSLDRRGRKTDNAWSIYGCAQKKEKMLMVPMKWHMISSKIVPIKCV